MARYGYDHGQLCTDEQVALLANLVQRLSPSTTGWIRIPINPSQRLDCAKDHEQLRKMLNQQLLPTCGLFAIELQQTKASYRLRVIHLN